MQSTRNARPASNLCTILTISQGFGFTLGKERSAGPEIGRPLAILCHNWGVRGSILDTCLQKCIMRHVRLAIGRRFVSPVVHRYHAATEVSDFVVGFVLRPST